MVTCNLVQKYKMEKAYVSGKNKSKIIIITTDDIIF